MNNAHSNWTAEDKHKLVDAFSVMAVMQKNYGREIDIKATLKAWEFVMGRDYTAEQVLMAMEQYMRQSSDIPAPSDLIKIIDPPEHKISDYEYRQNYKQWELAGFPQFSYEHQVVMDYRKQNEIKAPRPIYQVLNAPDKKLEIEHEG